MVLCNHHHQPGKMPQIKKICLLGLPSPHSLLRKWDENSQIRSEFNRIVFSFSSSPHYQSALALIIYHRNHWISHWVYRFSYRNDLLWLVISLLEVYGNNLTVTLISFCYCGLSDLRQYWNNTRFLKHQSGLLRHYFLTDNQYNANIFIILIKVKHLAGSERNWESLTVMI